MEIKNRNRLIWGVCLILAVIPIYLLGYVLVQACTKSEVVHFILGAIGVAICVMQIIFACLIIAESLSDEGII